MLTADYDQLGLRSGDKILDLGCGFGRHAFEARVVAPVSWPRRRPRRGRRGGGDVQRDGRGGRALADTLRSAAVQGDALHLPFPDGSFDA